MTGEGGTTRQAYQRIARWLAEQPKDFFTTRRGHAELMFRRIGITFNVYGDKDSTERLIPFDIIPASSSDRSGASWRTVSCSASRR